MPKYWKLIFPTRFAYEWIKDLKPDSTEERIFKLIWPGWLLGIEGFLAILINFDVPTWTLVVAGCFAASRVGEIVYAYYNDAMDSIEGRAKGKSDDRADLTKADRIRLVIKSYISLIINWALIFYTLPIFARSSSLFHIQSTNNCETSCAFTSVTDALYFSSVTITTIGFGDIYPTQPVSKLLTVGEVLVGMLVLVLAFGAYLGERDLESPKDRWQ